METLSAAWSLVSSFDPALWSIIFLSLKVSLTAVVIAVLIGAPVGAVLGIWSFPGRKVLIVISNAMMALPPVVVGLGVYLLLSRAGPLGSLGILFTPSAMIVAQSILILPIIVALSRDAISPILREYEPLMISLDVSSTQKVKTLLWDARFGILTAIFAGFGRAIAEVGAVIIVGGNINGVTRVMTTAIALETSKGKLELALALGLILITIAIIINAVVYMIGQLGRRYEGGLNV